MKAFDRVGWDYLLETCKHIGLKTHMLSRIWALYQKPQARLKVNSTLSDTVHIRNGTRQGCPLSPLLFILTLEPFIWTINNNPNIGGFNINSKIYKIAAYADDFLFFLTNPHISIPNLGKDFQYYGYVSNMKINYKKSEALNFTFLPNSLVLTRSTCSFKWETSALKYLGI